MKRLTVALLGFGLFTPTFFAQTAEQKEAISPGCVEIIQGTERHCEKLTPLPSAQTAQQAARRASEPTSSPRQRPQVHAPIVRIEYDSACGMCFGYGHSQTIIQARMMRSVLRTEHGGPDIEHPDKKSTRKITMEQWERAKAAVDTESFFSLPDTIECPGCFDEPEDWITVDYSDGTRKSVTCHRGGPDTDMVDKVDKIKVTLAQAVGKDLGWLNRP